MRISDWSSDVCSSDLAALDEARIQKESGTRVKPGVTGGCQQWPEHPRLCDFAAFLRRKRAPSSWREPPFPSACVGRSGGQLAQHILKDAAVQEVIQFVDGIDAAERGEVEGRAVGALHDHLDILAGLQAGDILDGEGDRKSTRLKSSH